MKRVLVVDDEPAVLQLFRRAFEHEPIELIAISNATQAIEVVRDVHPEVAIFDIQMPDMNGLDLLDRVLEIDPRLPVIFVTATGDSDSAIDAMKRGAYDYLLKPLNLQHIRQVLRHALEVRRMMSDPVAIGVPADLQSLPGTDSMVGQGQAMQEVYKAIGRVATRNIPLLIIGESGTGKELVARAVYQHSHRSRQAFLAINCAAIPEALLESELFGHEKGAFTGADRRRIGKFEQCHQGTLFLDEIGDMPLALQSKMLRVLQEQSFERVGGNETLRTDVRIIAATHRDLKKMADRGQFRLDLYYRLNTYEIRLPSLRERLEDLPTLIAHFLNRARQELGTGVNGVSPEALEILTAYPWPGNIRELQSVIKQAVIQSIGPVLLSEFLPETVRRAAREAAQPANQTIVSAPSTLERSTDPTGELVGGENAASRESADETRFEESSSWPIPAHGSPGELATDWQAFLKERLAAGSESIYDEAIAMAERHVIAGVLRHTDGNQVQAAKILGLARTTLRAKIRQLGISMGRTVDVD